MEKLWKEADVSGVPVPEYKQQKLTDANEYVFSSKQCKGDTFFQNSKSGHSSALKTWLEIGHDRSSLLRYKAIFKVAKMGDPQAFYENSENGAIEFIDIQKMTGGLMGDYADHVDEILKLK